MYFACFKDKIRAFKNRFFLFFPKFLALEIVATICFISFVFVSFLFFQTFLFLFEKNGLQITCLVNYLTQRARLILRRKSKLFRVEKGGRFSDFPSENERRERWGDNKKYLRIWDTNCPVRPYLHFQFSVEINCL